MKDTQHHLLIQDLDYCNTVCDDTEEIVGGISLWDAFTGTLKAKVEAVRKTAVDIVTQGTFPTGQTAQDLLDPLEIGVLRRFRPQWFWH